MKVISNFLMKSATDPTVDHWLQDIFDEIEKQSNADFLLRVNKEEIGKTCYYSIENRKNKTQATVSRRRTKLRLDLFERRLPDINKYIKPTLDNISSVVVENNEEGKNELASRIVYLLGEANDYSKGVINKVKVTSTGNVDKEKNTLLGGMIKEIINDENKSIITIENNGSFEIPRKEGLEKRIMVMKYIIFDDMLNFEILNDTEFSHYFEMI